MNLLDPNCYFFSTARFAFEFVFSSVHVAEKANKIILPSYTCQVLENSVLLSGYKPIYCDINSDSFFYDLDCLNEVIRKRSGEIAFAVLQHTYGYVDIDCYLQAIQLFRDNSIFTVDDCCHMTSYYFLESRADCSVFSFQATKGLPFVHGGFLRIRSQQLHSSVDTSYHQLSFNLVDLRLFVLQACSLFVYVFPISRLSRRLLASLARKFSLEGMSEYEKLGDLQKIRSDVRRRGRMPVLNKALLACVASLMLSLLNARRKRTLEVMSGALKYDFLSKESVLPLMLPSSWLSCDSSYFREIRNIIRDEVSYSWFTSCVFPSSSVYGDSYFEENFPVSFYLSTSIFTMPTLLSPSALTKLKLLLD